MPTQNLVLGPGMAIPPVGNCQEQLNAVCYYGLVVDNIYGPRTEAACRDYQARCGLPQTGVIDEATWRRLFAGIPLPADVVTVPIPLAPPDPTRLSQAGYGVILNLGSRTLRLLQYGADVATYPIAIGKPATPSPVGDYTILNKAVDPGGPFGTRWLGITENGLGIHGTDTPPSIGLAVSNGCIRMYNQDVEAIFPLLNVGDPVSILAGAAAPGAGVNYTVQPGDTLYSIARRYGTTVDAIKIANNLTTDIIYVDEILFIPGPIVGGPTSVYTVLPGDTLFSIAQRYGTTVSALQTTNNLTSDLIFPGQVLQIPTVPYSPPPQPGPGPAPGPGTTAYTVQPGDTLYLIALQFNTTVAELRRLNNIVGDLIVPGQVLVVPATGGVPPATGDTYTVRPGDTLFSIAQRFGTTVTELVRLNKLTTTEIFPGQVLFIR